MLKAVMQVTAFYRQEQYMFTFLLTIIYLAFISLGLPDSLLGAAWPLMSAEFGAPISYAGAISVIISASSITASLLSDKVTRKFGTGGVTFASVLLTATALLGFSLSDSFWILCVLAIPYGLGAGAVDAALNNYVAIHYAARHMSWLHCFWGVGASIGPYIMGWAISTSHGWRAGYGYISVIQFALTLVLLLTLPLWKKNVATDKVDELGVQISFKEVLKIRGVIAVVLGFFGYCAFEATAGLWASSFLVQVKGINEETAAFYASLFYLGITFGRFVCGFITDKLGDKQMIRAGIGVVLLGILLVILPLDADFFSLMGLVLLGLGAAPIYPSIIHSIPIKFGMEYSHAIVGMQMAFAYLGSMFMPPLFGLIAQYISIAIYPFYLLIFVILLLVMLERANKICKN